MPLPGPGPLDIECPWCHAAVGVPCHPNSLTETDKWSTRINDPPSHQQRNDDAFWARVAITALSE